MFAVSREVDLDDGAGDVLTVADPVEGRPKREVVEIHRTLNRSHGQEAVVRTEPDPQQDPTDDEGPTRRG